MDQLWTVLPFLGLLACPLMMVVCFVGMRRMGCSSPTGETRASSSRPSEERIADLQRQLATIEAELVELGTPTADSSPSPTSIGQTAMPATR